MMKVACIVALMMLCVGIHAQSGSESTTTTTSTTVNTVTVNGKTTTTTKITTTEVTKNERGEIIKSVTKVSEKSEVSYEDSVGADEADLAEMPKEAENVLDNEDSEEDDDEELDDAWGDVSALVNTAKNTPGLTLEEKKVYVFVNLARLDGKKFAEEYVEPFFRDRKYTQSYYKSLIRDLKRVKNLPMLKPNDKLIESAKYHAKDMGINDMTGHVSSDGTKMAERISRYFHNYKLIAENCSYGFDEAIKIVMQLLIDDGVESLGHRKNILDKELEYMGVSIAEHKYYKYNCVQDFGTSFK